MTTINPHTTRASGTILTAAIYNADHTNHITNAQALNAGKIEGATPPVVDGHIAVFDGTSGSQIRTSGIAVFGTPVSVANGGTGVTTAAAAAELFAQNGAGFGLQTDIASAGTTDLGTVATHNVQITGTTTITSFGSSADIDRPVFLVKFGAATPITHNSTTLALPGAANYTFTAGDMCVAEYIGGGNWRVRAIFTRSFPGRTVQRFTAGAGATYTAPAGLKYIKVRMVGGGGGGAASDTNAGTNGTTTSFGGWTAILGQGPAANAGSGNLGGVGGTGGANGTGTLINRIDGMQGQRDGGNAGASGGIGGVSPFGGAGTGGDGQAGLPAKANTGSGGGGGEEAGGGGAGEYVEFQMTAAQVGATQTYTVGAGGNGGAAGTFAGGNGAAGIIIVEEFYW